MRLTLCMLHATHTLQARQLDAFVELLLRDLWARLAPQERRAHRQLQVPSRGDVQRCWEPACAAHRLWLERGPLCSVALPAPQAALVALLLLIGCFPLCHPPPRVQDMIAALPQAQAPAPSSLPLPASPQAARLITTGGTGASPASPAQTNRRP